MISKYMFLYNTNMASIFLQFIAVNS